ncbi:MAG: SpoIIE family protein phosphatase [Mycobacterium sp.]|nr:SpoIIE family protein phosphatase [Mycobacterium sp.]
MSDAVAKSWVRTARLFVVVFVAYAAGALLAAGVLGGSELDPSFFPPAGVTVAALILSRRHQWPAVLAAIVLAETIVDLSAGVVPGATAGYALANSVEPLLGASLVLGWCRGVPNLGRRRDLFYFVVGACVAGPALGGFLGGGVVAWHLGAWWPGAALRWFASDGIGVLVVAAPILLWRKQSRILRGRPAETVAAVGSASALSWLSIGTGLSPSLLILPVLALAALRLDVLGAALAGAGTAFAANLRAVAGLTMFGDLDLSKEARLALVQLLIAINVLLAMVIAQEAAERRRATSAGRAERDEIERLQTLANLASQLSAALTTQDVGRVVERQLTEEMGAAGVGVVLLNADSSALESVATVGFPSPVVTAMGADAIGSGLPVLFRTEDEYLQRFGPASRIGGITSAIGWPLAADGRTVGALLLGWSEPQLLHETQQAFMSAAATMISQALERAKPLSELRARAVMLRQAAHPDARDDTVGLEYSTLYRPADTDHDLGGDWYSVMALPGDRTYLTVGDVVGHGLMAVEDMAQLRSTGNAYAYQGLGPAQLLTELNRFAARQLRGDFATSFVAIFDHEAESLSYSSAGHLPALLRRAGTGEVIALDAAAGPILGPFVDSVYEESTVSLGPGDVVILYTDGLVESYDERIDVGISHLMEIIGQWPPEALLDCDALTETVAPAPQPDDVSLLIARVEGRL